MNGMSDVDRVLQRLQHFINLSTLRGSVFPRQETASRITGQRQLQKYELATSKAKEPKFARIEFHLNTIVGRHNGRLMMRSSNNQSSGSFNGLKVNPLNPRP